ncbi:hypothetical protein [Sorangium sp. So ce861]|uniref:hypothetical protein n=1 Tax=Sorangium sp. So ce861 TaxID=3133323 RepID=UPI003F5FBDF8
MALLDSLRDASAEGNVPLHLLLGMVSFARRLDRLLGAPGAPAATPAATQPGSMAGTPATPPTTPPATQPGSVEPEPGSVQPTGAEASPGDAATDARSDALIFLLLGAISVRRTLLAELDPLREARREQARREDHGAPDPAAAGRGLRSLLR